MQHPLGTRPQLGTHRKIGWELVACGCAGHALVGTDAAVLRPQDELYAREQGSIRWLRCLRCDSWVALKRPENPARRYPPDRESIQIPRRGKALRDRVVLRVIAIDRGIHFIILTALGIGVLAIAGNADALRSRFYRVLTALQNGAAGGAAQSGQHAGFFHALDKLSSLGDDLRARDTSWQAIERATPPAFETAA